MSRPRSVSWVCELSRWTDGVEELSGWSAVPSLRPATHTVFFSIHQCQDCADACIWWLYLSYGGISHATCSTRNKSHTHSSNWHFSMRYLGRLRQTLAQVATDSICPLCVYPWGEIWSIKAYSSGIKGRPFFVLLIWFVAECYSNTVQRLSNTQ